MSQSPTLIEVMVTLDNCCDEPMIRNSVFESLKKKEQQQQQSQQQENQRETKAQKEKEKKSLTIFDGFTLELSRISSNQLGDHGNVRSSHFSKKQKFASKFGLHSTPHLRTHLTKQQMEAI